MQDYIPQQYIKNLTGVRAYFSLWIVLFHYSASPLVGTDLAPLFAQGHLATDFFLILSGFVVSYIYFDKMNGLMALDYLHFLLKRFARLYPLHILTFLIVLAFYIVLSLSGHVPADPQQYSWSLALLNIFMMHAWVPQLKLGWNFVSWSVSAEWFAYLLPFLFVLTGWRKLSQSIRGALILCLYLLYVTHVADAILPERLIRMSFAFLYGTWLFHFLPNLQGIRQRTWRGLGLGLIALVLVLVLQNTRELTFVVAPIWGLLILALFHEKAWSKPIFTNPLAMHLGKISFSTYLVHGVLAKLLFQLDSSRSRYTEAVHQISPYGLLSFALIVTLVISHLTHHHFEVPARIWVLKHGDVILKNLKMRTRALNKMTRVILSNGKSSS